MNRTDRLYGIAEELRAAGKRGRSSIWLADRFEVATRTIKRDVSSLQQSGVPIWATGGPGGGYVLDNSASLPPITFTSSEAIALATVLATSEGAPFAVDGQTALTKVVGAMTASGRHEVSQLAERVWIRETERDETDPQALRTLEEAVRRDVVVVLDYVDRDGHRTDRRRVDPLAFGRNRGRWYLMAWCHRRKDGRWFRLDRVAAAHLTSEATSDRSLEDVFGLPDDVSPVLDP